LSAPVAVVTGAARGIGAAVAVLGARAGWQLVLVDACADDASIPYRLATRAELDATVADCGDNAVGVVGDVRSQAALDAAVATAVERFGGLDIAVAVAGVVGGGPTGWETDDDLWSAVLDVNLGGVRRLARAAVPALLQRPQPRAGRFVAVASASSTVGLPRLSAYAAAKHGVVGFVRSLAAELGPEGVTANAVAPGSTRTEGLAASAALYGLESAEDFAVHHLDPRLLEPEEIAEAVIWLCSAAASGVTGAVLPVDAGLTAR
jgi:SDR family mycofactocin-dependent oxidoreductase